MMLIAIGWCLVPGSLQLASRYSAISPLLIFTDSWNFICFLSNIFRIMEATLLFWFLTRPFLRTWTSIGIHVAFYEVERQLGFIMIAIQVYRGIYNWWSLADWFISAKAMTKRSLYKFILENIVLDVIWFGHLRYIMSNSHVYTTF